MPASSPIVADAAVSAYVTYSYEGEDWGLTAGAGGSWEIDADGVSGALDVEEQDFYQAGLNLSLGNFSIGIAGEYFNDVVGLALEGTGSVRKDIWVAGAGIAYRMDAWTFGAQYSHRQDGLEFIGADLDYQGDRVVLTAQYALGPGIMIDGELGYTWADTDPELTNSSGDEVDDYQALEFGIGTSISF